MKKIAGYVKLSKKWENSKASAIEFYTQYFIEEYGKDLEGVYIDITGDKEIHKRKEFIKVLSKCKNSEIDIIATPTRAYLARNSEDFCYLIHYLSQMPTVKIITDDDDRKIDTVRNIENQKENLEKMAQRYVEIKKKEYDRWVKKIEKAINLQNE